MNTEQHIHHLLFHHDCIIIPGFGGFVANQRTAFLNPAHHTFSPPSKKIAFNSSLRINDGLLANHMSKSMHISYKEAGERIDHFVRNCMVTLINGERLMLENVGELYYDAEKNLQFIPDNAVNYLKDSFGLTSIHSPAIKRDAEASNLMNVIHTNAGSLRKGKLKSWRLIELIPAAAVLTWLMLSPPLLSNMNLGNLNPFAQPKNITQPNTPEKSEAKYSYFEQENNKATTNLNTSDSLITTDEKELSNAHTATEELLATPTATTSATDAIIEADIVPAKKIIVAKADELIPVSEISTEKLTYVIGGCFRDYTNAVNFRNEALADGFQAAIIGERKGLHMVSLFSSKDANRASTEMEIIKTKFQPQAWLFRQ